jgi:hypothetical protein
MSIAFMIGNGKSRLDYNINCLKKYGKTYGCNALYRDMMPDYLVSVDTNMLAEIIEAEVYKKTEVWTNPRKANEKYKQANFFRPGRGWSSGPTALWMASEHKYDAIYILGFDYSSIDKKLNNVYGSTPNYKDKNDVYTFFGNWERQTMETITNHKNISYVRVLTDKYTFIPDKLAHIDNLSHINIIEFKEKFPEF